MKKGRSLFLVAIIVALVFLLNISCKSLKYSNLKANFYFKKANAKYEEEDYSTAAKYYIEVIKADPDFIAAYFYLGSCYQQIFKPGLPFDKDLVLKIGNALDKIKDLNLLKETVKKIDTINDYEELKKFAENLKVPEEEKIEEKKEVNSEEGKEVTEEKVEGKKIEGKTGEETKKINKEESKEKEGSAEEEKAENSTDEKVEAIIKKWEEEKKAEEAKKKAEEEAKKRAKKSLVVTEQPTQKPEKKEEQKPQQLNPQQRKLMVKNTLRAVKALANTILIKHYDTATLDSTLALADLYDKLGIFDKAEKYYLEILKAYKTNKAYYVISDFYAKYGKNDKAIEYLNKAIKLNPNDPDGYLYLAKFYSESMGKYDEAIKAVEQMINLIEKDPNVDNHKKAVAYYWLGFYSWAKSFKKKYMPPDERAKVVNKGMEALMKAIELDPKYPEPYAYVNLLYREKIKVNPAKKKEYLAKADEYRNKFQELYKRLQERQKLAKELEKQK